MTVARGVSLAVVVSLLGGLAAPVRAAGPAEPAATPAEPAVTPTAVAEPTSAARPAQVPTTPTDAPAPVHEEVQQAYTRAQQAMSTGQLDLALAELAYVLAAASTWSAAYRLRADVYARLAVAHAPNAAFLRAEAQDLAYVVELEPAAEDRPALERRISALYDQAARAAQTESRRRKLRAPAMVVTAFSIAGIGAGAFLLGITPSDKPTAFGHRDNDIGGIVALSTGVALGITAAILGGLAMKQTRSDRVVTRYYEVASRRRLEWAAAPMWARSGAGMSFGLRF